MNSEKPPYLGFGLGLRPQHIRRSLRALRLSTGSRSSPRTTWSEYDRWPAKKHIKDNKLDVLLYALDLGSEPNQIVAQS
jgi:hypothetical protein